ncbi:hypothetical protein [Streptacidiphilus pinicola]|nr:hypothetical protein [Streptacidiphilus pinicola]
MPSEPPSATEHWDATFTALPAAVLRDYLRILLATAEHYAGSRINARGVPRIWRFIDDSGRMHDDFDASRVTFWPDSGEPRWRREMANAVLSACPEFRCVAYIVGDVDLGWFPLLPWPGRPVRDRHVVLFMSHRQERASLLTYHLPFVTEGRYFRRMSIDPAHVAFLRRWSDSLRDG